MSDYTNESKAAVVVNNHNTNDDLKEHQKNLNQLQHQLLSMVVGAEQLLDCLKQAEVERGKMQHQRMNSVLMANGGQTMKKDQQHQLQVLLMQAEKQHLEDELEEEGSGVHGNGMSSLQASLWKSLGLRAAIAEAKTSRDRSGLEIELQSALDTRASTQTPALRQLIKEAETLLHELPVTRATSLSVCFTRAANALKKLRKRTSAGLKFDETKQPSTDNSSAEIEDKPEDSGRSLTSAILKGALALGDLKTAAKLAFEKSDSEDKSIDDSNGSIKQINCETIMTTLCSCLTNSIVVLTTHRGYIMLRAGSERLLRLLSRQNTLVKKCLSKQRSMLGTVAATASYAATVHRAGRVLVRIKRKKQEIQNEFPSRKSRATKTARRDSKSATRLPHNATEALSQLLAMLPKLQGTIATLTEGKAVQPNKDIQRALKLVGMLHDLKTRTGGSGLQQVFKLVMLRLVKLQRRLVTNCALLRYSTSTDSNREAQEHNTSSDSIAVNELTVSEMLVMGERVVGSLLELLDNAARDDQTRSKRVRTDPLVLNAKQLRQRLAMEARFATKLYHLQKPCSSIVNRQTDFNCIAVMSLQRAEETLQQVLELLVEMKNSSSPLSLKPIPGEDMGMGDEGGMGANRSMGLKPRVMMEGPAEIVRTRLVEYVTNVKKSAVMRLRQAVVRVGAQRVRSLEADLRLQRRRQRRGGVAGEDWNDQHTRTAFRRRTARKALRRLEATASLTKELSRAVAMGLEQFEPDKSDAKMVLAEAERLVGDLTTPPPPVDLTVVLQRVPATQYHEELLLDTQAAVFTILTTMLTENSCVTRAAAASRLWHQHFHGVSSATSRTVKDPESSERDVRPPSPSRPIDLKLTPRAKLLARRRSLAARTDTLSTADVEARNQRREARRVKTRRKVPSKSPSRFECQRGNTKTGYETPLGRASIGEIQHQERMKKIEYQKIKEAREALLQAERKSGSPITPSSTSSGKLRGPSHEFSRSARDSVFDSPSMDECKQQQAEIREWLHNSARENTSKVVGHMSLKINTSIKKRELQLCKLQKQLADSPKTIRPASPSNELIAKGEIVTVEIGAKFMRSYGFLKKQSQLRGFQRNDNGRDTMMVVLFKELNKSRLLFHSKKFGSTSPFHPYRRRIRRYTASSAILFLRTDEATDPSLPKKFWMALSRHGREQLQESLKHLQANMEQAVLRARKEDLEAEAPQDRRLRPSPSRRYVPGTDIGSQTTRSPATPPPNLPPSTEKLSTISTKAGLHRPSSISANTTKGSASYLPQSASSTITKRIVDKNDSIRTSTTNQVAITSKPSGLDSASKVAEESATQVKDDKASNGAPKSNNKKQRKLKDSNPSPHTAKSTSAKFNRRERAQGKANASERGANKAKSIKTTPTKAKAHEPMTDKADNVTARRVRPASLNSRGHELASGRPAKAKPRGGTSVSSREGTVTTRRVRPASLNTRGYDLASGRTVTGNKLSSQTDKKMSVQTGKHLAMQSGKTLTPQTVPNRKKPRNIGKIGRSQSMRTPLRSSTQNNKILRRNSMSTPRVQQSSPRIIGGSSRRRAEVPIRRRNSIATTNPGSMSNRGGVGPLRTRHQQSMKPRQPMAPRNNNSNGSGVRIRRTRTSPGLSRGRSVSDRRRGVPRMDARKDSRNIPMRQKKPRSPNKYLGNRKSIKDRVKRPIQSFGNLQDHVWPHEMRIEF